MLTIEEAKAYLRVDSDFEDELIASLLASSESICMDVARLTAEEWTALTESSADGVDVLTIRGERKSPGEARRVKEILRVGVFYTLGYLYEHREEADHHDLVMTLRNLLFSVREGVF